MSKIAIIGRPNVGKSTLFNRLIGRKVALVAAMPELTVDRHYGLAQLEGGLTTVIDCGGVVCPTSPWEQSVLQQTEQAIQEAELILLVVDGRTEVTNSDQQLVTRLRKQNKPVLLVINKIDQPEQLIPDDYYQLGCRELFLISAEHNLGMAALTAAITAKLNNTAATITTISTSTLPTEAVKIAFIGRPNVGKSTLVNQLLGEERVVVSDQPGTTRDSIAIEFRYRNKPYVLIDTAGIRRRRQLQANNLHTKIEKFAVIKTQHAISSCEVAVLLLDATEAVTEQDLKLVALILDQGKALVIAVNKWDHLPAYQRDKIKAALQLKLAFANFIDIHFISALHGSGLSKLFQSIDRSWKNTSRTLSTPKLTRLLAAAVKNHAPPLVNGRAIKLRYAHLGQLAPPTIVIHGTRLTALPTSYHKYLTSFFHQALSLRGTPIQLRFNSSS